MKENKKRNIIICKDNTLKSVSWKEASHVHKPNKASSKDQLQKY